MCLVENFVLESDVRIDLILFGRKIKFKNSGNKKTRKSKSSMDKTRFNILPIYAHTLNTLAIHIHI